MYLLPSSFWRVSVSMYLLTLVFIVLYYRADKKSTNCKLFGNLCISLTLCCFCFLRAAKLCMSFSLSLSFPTVAFFPLFTQPSLCSPISCPGTSLSPGCWCLIQTLIWIIVPQEIQPFLFSPSLPSLHVIMSFSLPPCVCLSLLSM